MATHNNSKPAAELRIGTVKATVWENEVGGITHHSVTFSRIYPEGASGRPRRASVSSTCSPLPSSPIRRTRSSPSVKPRRPRRLATTKPAKRRTSRRRVKPRRLFFWTPEPPGARLELSAAGGEGCFGGYSICARPRTASTTQSEAAFSVPPVHHHSCRMTLRLNLASSFPCSAASRHHFTVSAEPWATPSPIS